MYIILIAWIYVVFMMAITETSAVAGVLTFLLYGVLPASIIFYIGTSGKRKTLRQRQQEKDNAEKKARASSEAQDN
ncbi:MAG: hypothetical protein REI95_09695 [Oxalicibacterium faecigallinarum]|uniref:Transmembrane protein n=1 Tax=Oxalicibacterium faecigallinarum TaxID=573741 RepID=A0A8J3F136_9BURK|nr:hypothetical protein [Oxalicibacterium faecigallinarum]MDQ7969903.1 hypothetical protein [Oxalicibacterium faecigallinarum]GGI16534.1 hypothetical protein GCM10008066_04440 [Oxalicibacterium faecigallinarum]